MNYSLRLPYAGRIEREGPLLVPHSLAFPAAMTALKVLLGGTHRLRELSMHGRPWRADLDYFDFVGLSGEGFLHSRAAADFLRQGDPAAPAPIADCFEAVGLPVDVLGATATGVRAAVLANLDAGFPALVFARSGVERVILATGYEAGGETLVGWTFVPGADMSNKSFDSDACQFLDDWTRGVAGAALVRGAPVARSCPPAVTRRALSRAAGYLRSGEDYVDGKLRRYYDVWAKRLADSPDWDRPFQGLPGIDPVIWDFAERRCWAGEFLKDAAETLAAESGRSGADALALAIGACAEIHDLMWKIHGLCDGVDGQERLRASATRAEIVAILRRCEALDAAAADAIEVALEATL